MTEHRFCEECNGTMVFIGLKKVEKKIFECWKCALCDWEVNEETDKKKYL